MPENSEEKEKCLGKLMQMQKYLPFLDFMINKIKKKNNESSLKSQLSKFQVLRSMIAEKNGKYTWDEIIKVEDVIKKLISKLDFKGQYQKLTENLTHTDNENCKTKVATSTSTVSVKTPCSQTPAADSKSQESTTNAVELIMKALKVSADISMKKSTDGGTMLLPNSMGSSHDALGRSKESNLDKDLDGFDLTESESSNGATEGVSAAAPEKLSSRDELLSSSREKLLKSLHDRLLPCKSGSQKSPTVSKSDKTSESQSVSSRTHVVSSEVKGIGGISESVDHNTGDLKSRKSVDNPDGIHEKPIPILTQTTKPFSLPGKIRSDSTTATGEVSLKKKLKEKLSTEICEVYRVPGKSVGGSLRSLKEVKDRKKPFSVERDDLFKPGKISEKSDPKCAGAPQAKVCPEKKDGTALRSHPETSASKSDKKASRKECETTRTRQDSKEGNENSKSTESRPPSKSEPSKYDNKMPSKECSGSQEEKTGSSKKNDDGKIMAQPMVDKLDDEELLKFIKENMQCLPHLSKLNPAELRKVIKSSIVESQEIDLTSEISDDSLADFEEPTNSGSNAKAKNSANSPGNTERRPHPLPSVKIAQIGPDGAAKKVKPIAEPKKDAKVLDKIGDRTLSIIELDDLSEEEYAQRLIEETTPRVTPVRKKKLLDLPLPVIDDLFDDISSIESFETLNNPKEGESSRLPLPKFSDRKIRAKNKPESTRQPRADQSSSKAPGGVLFGLSGRANPQPPKDSSQVAKVQTGPVPPPVESLRTQRTNQNRPDPWPSKPLTSHSFQEVNLNPQLNNWYLVESNFCAVQNIVSYGQPPVYSFVANNIVRHSSYGYGEPKSYAEYKRLKLKEQEKLSQQETTAKESAKSIAPDSSTASEMSRILAERDPRRRKDLHPKQTNTSNHPLGSSSEDKRKPRSREEKRSHEETGKVGADKRHSADMDELVSPLEQLYGNESKPQTGRGYGQQNFKIPKRGREWTSQGYSKPNENQAQGVPFDKAKAPTWGTQSEADSSKDVDEMVNSLQMENWDDEGGGAVLPAPPAPTWGTRSEADSSKGVDEMVKSLQMENWDDEGGGAVLPAPPAPPAPTWGTRSEADSSKDVDEMVKSLQMENWDDEGGGAVLPAPPAPTWGTRSEADSSKDVDEMVKSLQMENWDDEGGGAVLPAPPAPTWGTRSEADSSKDVDEMVSSLQMEDWDKEGGGSGAGAGNTVEEIGSKTGEEKSEQNCTSNCDAIKDVPSKSTEKLESNKAVSKTESSIIESDSTNREAVGSKTASESVFTRLSGDRLAEQGKVEVKVSSNSDKTETLPEKDVAETDAKPAETPQKCEAQVAECDSSMENPGTCQENVGKESTSPGDKSATVSKEEITQEFVESLIRKSFQSGEGKLLLAHAKLFEELAKKLNSKKLKTIQKIINSETDSSSSSAEAISEDERKRKKGKKSEERILKNKKVKRRGKRIKKLKSSSSSASPCESEDSSEEESCGKKENKGGNKQREVSLASDDEDSKSQRQSSTDETKSRDDSPVPTIAKKKMKKRRRNTEFLKQFNGRKAKRKRQQKKRLEQIMNESNPSDAPAKESKSKPRTKGKVKTELDRLHEDIKSMFFNKGGITPTGHRMCRILKQSGGNIKNLDLVKESAKMVEEEKLKNVCTRRSAAKNYRASRADNSDSRSRSQSLDKTSKTRETENGVDPKLEKQPIVLLQRANLSKFGYGVKISEGCLSFRRLKGRNTAIKSRRSRTMSKEDMVQVSSEDSLVRNVFLPRNKRKVKRMKDAKGKKEYVKKKLMDVVRNLPLKMAKMKHLQICEKKEQKLKEQKQKKVCSGKLLKRGDFHKKKSEFSNEELLNYAFERVRVMYSCKLCSQVTRYITGHYKVVHPDHEVLISRLCVGEAKRAKLDAKRNGYNSPKSNESAQTVKQKLKTILGPFASYNCRMCSSVKTQDLEMFKAHVSSHTGEFRFECPAEGCCTRTYSSVDIKIHILTKHGKNRTEYNKVNEIYTITVDGGKMFGFLCSVCNFVQLCRDNVKDHISRQHGDFRNAVIIKINMSANLPKVVKKKFKKTTSGEKNASKSRQNTTNAENSTEKAEMGSQKTGEGSPKIKETDEKENTSTNTVENAEHDDREEHDEGDKEMKAEEINEEEEAAKKSPDSSEQFSGGCKFEKEPQTAGEVNLGNGKDGGDMQSFVESSQDVVPKQENVEGLQKIKVGPLEARLLRNSSVVYECYVKGCLFYTQTFDLFEKHIKISHWKTEWDGICEICNGGQKAQPSRDNSCRLLIALKHLRLHEREIITGRKLSEDELIMELKLLSPSEECIVENEEPDAAGNDAGSPPEPKEAETPATKKTDNPDVPLPPKPLLRVRNLLGDRLSTPKESPEENEVAAITEQQPPPAESHPKLFTIENVRSLNDAPSEDTDIQIEHVCSLKDPPKTIPPLAPGKTILVRSCPTRKIAIRPEPSAVSIDVGQLSVVQAPTSTHSVVLAPLTTAAPIRIISSSALAPKPKFAVQPIIVSPDAGRMNTPNLLSILASPVSTVVPNEPKSTPQAPPPVLPESSPANQISVGLKPTMDVTVIPSPSLNNPGSPVSSGMIDVEEFDEKDAITLQKLHHNLNAGNKRVKDAKIYEEMLTKTKLCHLFKCMGIECSFSCNSECVFRQHIGLHEAQRRLRKNKGIRTIFFRLANKTTRAFYWQQCAYCCELFTNTNNTLSQHVLEEHGHCMYQCAFCFYRAVSHSYVEIHQNLAHGQVLKTTPRIIYKCKPLRTPPTQVAALVKHGRRQSVRPYHCDQCGRKFYITQDFIKHLTTQHQSVTAYTCHICKNLCFKADRLVVHYKLHSYCTYQCAYCLHGTETEKEMVFHLCNFHFSQPAIMYVRAIADGQKNLSNQLDSLKVIVYESDTLTPDCIVEVDTDDEASENPSDGNADLSSIVAELGINTDPQSQSCVTPLMKELASIGDNTAKNLTVKTLLPNAQFSSENENGTENCSVLISSGLSTPSDQNSDKEMSIPLGQLPLEVVNVQHNDRASRQQSPEIIPEAINVSSPDKNLKLSEIIENLQNKEKGVVVPKKEELNQPAVIASAVHKLPPVVLSRGSASKNVYSSKSALMKKKSEEAGQPSENTEGGDGEKSAKKSSSETEEKSPEDDVQSVTPSESTAQSSAKEEPNDDSKKSSEKPPLVVSLSGGETTGSENSSEVCCLSPKTDSISSGTPSNAQSRANSPTLEPPIIRVQDFPIGEENKVPAQEKTDEPEPEKKDGDEKSDKVDADPSSSPDIIILEEEKSNDIITVTLDSDEEKVESPKREAQELKTEKEVPKSPTEGESIRKEMELLRNQIESETDSLLFDEEEGEKKTKEKRTEEIKIDLPLSIDPASEGTTKESLLSPIEEAICSLNKKLQSETEQAQKKDGRKKAKTDECSSKSDSSASESPERPRTRFAAKDRRKEGGESGEKDESGGKKDSPGKCKKPKEDLEGKELFICGNGKCNFAANDDLELKDHLYVCDLSRESTVLVCPHCSRQIKQFHPYLEHLKYHGQKKHHCGLCDYSSPVDSSVTRHVKQKHKCTLVKVLPKDSQPGHMVYYPKNHKVVEKVDFEEGYSPGEADKLPLQSVYQVNVKCAKCPYFTKVRSNMVRHLKIHLKSDETEGVVVVPSTAPTNPVPCLETKERMFDKMSNLAASSQLQAKEKAVLESLSSEVAAKLPQFVAEQMRYKCCLPDCNYITVDDSMLRHHIKALHAEINYYSCPHCRDTVHVDVRHVTLDKIGHHLKHHDAKLYKCGHCIFFHYMKNIVEKHTAEKHPDRRFFVHTVRAPKPETVSEDEPSPDGGPRVWRCGLCETFRSPSKPSLMDHLLKTHNTKSKYRCKLCSMKGNGYQAFLNHFSSKHPGEKVEFTKMYFSENVPTGSLESGNSSGADSSSEHFDTTPLWQRGTPRVRHIRGILIEEEEIKTKKLKRTSVEESEADTPEEEKTVKENAFYCPLCTNKKKQFYTRSEDCFRTHLYQELNYHQFACILCGKMFVDRKDFDRHHTRVHPDKEPAVKQTKEDHEIKFWVDQVIEERRKRMEDRKRKLSDSGETSPAPKKKKEV